MTLPAYKEEKELVGVWIAVFIIMMLLLTLPCTMPGCVAVSKTRKWARENARRAAQAGMPEEDGQEAADAVPLVEPSNSDSDSDLADDDDIFDEADAAYRQAKLDKKQRERDEEILDQQLTARQRFFKEWKKGVSGPSEEQLARDKEM